MPMASIAPINKNQGEVSNFLSAQRPAKAKMTNGKAIYQPKLQASDKAENDFSLLSCLLSSGIKKCPKIFEPFSALCIIPKSELNARPSLSPNKMVIPIRQLR